MNQTMFALPLVLAAFAGAASAAPTGSTEQSVQPDVLGHAAYEGRSLVRVQPNSMREFLAVSAIAETILDERPGPGRVNHVMVDADGRAAIEALGLTTETVVEDVRQVLIEEDAANTAARLGAPGFDYQAYYPLADIEQKLAGLVNDNPGLVVEEVIGQSLEGRDIRMLRITGPGSSEGRAKVLINSLQHAREWITPPATIYLAEQLLSRYGSDAEITDLMDNIEFLIVPVVNPDGYVYSWSGQRLWRKNRRDNNDGTEGVDLNRNWTFQFGGPGSSGFGGSETFRGPSPLSEPETQVLAGVFTSNPDIVAHVDTHSFSQLVLYPYGASTTPPPDRRLFEVLSRDMADAIEDVYGKTYVPQRGIDLYAASGILTDYAYGERNALSWTFELRPRNTNGGGFAAPLDQILPTAEEVFEAYLEIARSVRGQLLGNVPMAAGAPLGDGEARSLYFEILPVTDNVDPSSVRAEIVADGSTIAATLVGGDVYRVDLPAAVCGDDNSFRLLADTASGETRVLGDAVDGVYRPSVGEYSGVFADGFQTDAGWVVNGAAVNGEWVRTQPTGGGSSPVSDADGDGWAYVSGFGSSDVDDGQTELMSPVFSPGSEARVSYNYWFNGTPGRNDRMVVEVFDGNDWNTVREYLDPIPAWQSDSISIGPDGDAPSWVASRVRFRVRDVAEDNTVEAAVDAFSVERLVTSCDDDCAADVDGNGVAGPSDFTFWLTYFNTPSLPGSERADLDGDGQITPSDFTAWLAAFNQGC